MSQAIDDLRREHDAILSALDILDRIEVEAKQSTAATGDIAAFISFLKEFVDTCHHGKEEGMLFPALTRAGASEREASVPTLLSEHEQGRPSSKRWRRRATQCSSLNNSLQPQRPIRVTSGPTSRGRTRSCSPRRSRSLTKLN